jgi:hypothetical protein
LILGKKDRAKKVIPNAKRATISRRITRYRVSAISEKHARFSIRWFLSEPKQIYPVKTPEKNSFIRKLNHSEYELALIGGIEDLVCS